MTENLKAEIYEVMESRLVDLAGTDYDLKNNDGSTSIIMYGIKATKTNGETPYYTIEDTGSEKYTPIKKPFILNAILRALKSECIDS